MSNGQVCVWIELRSYIKKRPYSGWGLRDGSGSGGEREWGMGDRACALSYVMSPLQGLAA